MHLYSAQLSGETRQTKWWIWEFPRPTEEKIVVIAGWLLILDEPSKWSLKMIELLVIGFTG